MIEQEELSILYHGHPVKVMSFNNGTDTFFSVRLPNNDIELKVEYIDDNPYWTENGVVTERSEELGRLIEESDSR